jgi:uncharacterized protein involved in outer membrane biogenesis
LKLNDLTLTQGHAEAKGRVAFAFEKDHNTFDGALTLPSLSVAPIDPATAWSERALDLPSFSNSKGKLEINAQTLSFGQWSTDQPKLTLLADGTTASLTLQARRNNDQLDVNLSATQEDVSPTFSVAAKLASIDVGPMLAGLSGTAFAAGPANGEVNLKSSGRNLAEIVSKASGTVAFNLDKATLQGKAAQQIFVGSDASTAATMQITADMKDGLAVLNVKSAKVAGKTYAIKGEVDVLRKALALDITPQGGKRWGVAGPWLKPNIGADSAGAPEAAPAANQPATDSN